MKASTLKMLVLGVNLALAGGVVFLGVTLATEKHENLQKSVSNGLNQKRQVRKSDMTETQAKAAERKTLFNGEWTTFGVKPVIPNGTGTQEPPKPRIMPLKDLIEISGLYCDPGKVQAAIIKFKGKDKQEMVRAGDPITGVTPEAVLLRVEIYKSSSPQSVGLGAEITSKIGAAIFKYDNQEVTVEFLRSVKNPAVDPMKADSGFGGSGKTNPSGTGDGSSTGSNTGVKPDYSKPPEGAVYIDSPGGDKATYYESTNTWEIPQSEVDYFRKNQEALKKEVQFATYTENGVVQGVKVASLDHNGLAYQRGFREDDIVVSVNDVKVTNTKEVYDLQHNNAVTEAATVHVKILRNGVPINLRFKRQQVEDDIKGQ